MEPGEDDRIFVELWGGSEIVCSSADVCCADAKLLLRSPAKIMTRLKHIKTNIFLIFDVVIILTSFP